jgi:hypothetical protein
MKLLIWTDIDEEFFINSAKKHREKYKKGINSSFGWGSGSTSNSFYINDITLQYNIRPYGNVNDDNLLFWEVFLYTYIGSSYTHKYKVGQNITLKDAKELAQENFDAIIVFR